MNNYSFYTPTKLVERMFALIPDEAPVRYIADICCGTWNMLNAAKARYPSAFLVGVDINQQASAYHIANSEFVLADGRIFSKSYPAHNRKFDLLLSNPPFGALNLADKVYSGKNVMVSTKRIECEMIYANYSILADMGWFIVLLPSTYYDGKTYLRHRVWLADHFLVHAVVKLPSNTFRSNLNTVGLLLQKKPSNSTDSICTHSYSAQQDERGEWQLYLDETILPKRIAVGAWAGTLLETSPSIERESIMIYRGNISSEFFVTKKGNRILHCSSIINNGQWQCGERLFQKPEGKDLKFAEIGDVIINRIGKYAGYWQIYDGDRMPISDCIIVVKSPGQEIINVFKAKSDRGRLQIPCHGIACQYVTIDDIKNLWVAPYNHK